MGQGLRQVRKFRKKHNDTFYFNWLLKIEREFQTPFKPTHENMRAIKLDRALPPHILAANLRRVFSGIVSGNVKPEGREAVRNHGPFEICGDPEIINTLDSLLAKFVASDRMKLPGGEAYEPCYRIAD